MTPGPPGRCVAVRKQSRVGGLSRWAYAATGVLGVLAIALKGPTDGRSFDVLVLIGVIAIVAVAALVVYLSVRYVLRFRPAAA